VPIAVALTRVTVGNTEWLLMKFTPSWRNRQILGVSSGVIESGRNPSSTRTRLSTALPAAAGLAPSTDNRTAAMAAPREVCMFIAPGLMASSPAHVIDVIHNDAWQADDEPFACPRSPVRGAPSRLVAAWLTSAKLFLQPARIVAAPAGGRE